MAKDPPRGFLTGLGRLGSTALLVIVGGLFAVDLVVPDILPYVDEIILGIMTILLARWRSRRYGPAAEPQPPPKNVTPPGERPGEDR